MCKFCSNKTKDFVIINEQTEPYSQLEFAISNSGMLRVRHNYAVVRNCKEINGFDTQDIINISFCPFCGKRLA